MPISNLTGEFAKNKSGNENRIHTRMLTFCEWKQVSHIFPSFPCFIDITSFLQLSYEAGMVIILERVLLQLKLIRTIQNSFCKKDAIFLR